jgi:hypothetical protein
MSASKPKFNTIADIIKINNITGSQKMLGVLLVIMILSLFYTSSDIGISETQSYAAVISVLMIIIAISLYNLFTDTSSSIFIKGPAIVAIVLFLLGGIIFEFFQNYTERYKIFDSSSRDPVTRIAINIVEITLIISIIIVGLSFANNQIKRYLNNSSDWLGFVLNLIIYIPCLFEDLVKYFKEQYDLTASTTFIIFIIELILISIYIALPKLLSSKLVNDSIQIINEPVFLDIPVATNFKNQDDGVKQTKRANYAISMWIYLNQQTSSVDSAHIFSFGDSYIKIEYITPKNDLDIDKDKYRFTIKGEDKPYEINMQNQKWNNIVLNLNENKTVDIFVNGNLERTFTKSQRLSTENSTPTNITIGNSDGLYGAICNIKYYQNPLSYTQIIQNYNLLYNKNPPVNKIM